MAKKASTSRRERKEDEGLSITLQVDFTSDKAPSSPSSSSVSAAFASYGRVVECSSVGRSRRGSVFTLKLSPAGTLQSMPVPTGLLVLNVDGTDRVAVVSRAREKSRSERSKKRSTSLPPAKHLSSKQLQQLALSQNNNNLDITDGHQLDEISSCELGRVSKLEIINKTTDNFSKSIVRLRGFTCLPDEELKRTLEQRFKSLRQVLSITFDTYKMKPVCSIIFDSDVSATAFLNQVSATGGIQISPEIRLTAELVSKNCEQRNTQKESRLFRINGLNDNINDELLLTSLEYFLPADQRGSVRVLYRTTLQNSALVCFHKAQLIDQLAFHLSLSCFVADPSVSLSATLVSEPNILQVFCSRFATTEKDSALNALLKVIENRPRCNPSADYDFFWDKKLPALLLLQFDDSRDARWLLSNASHLLSNNDYVIYAQYDMIERAVPRNAMVFRPTTSSEKACKLQFSLLQDRDFLSFLEFVKTKSNQFEHRVREKYKLYVDLQSDQLASEVSIVQLDEKTMEDSLVVLDEWIAFSQRRAVEIFSSHFIKFSITVKMGTWTIVTDKLTRVNIGPEPCAKVGIEMTFRYPTIRVCGPKESCANLYAQMCKVLAEEIK